MYYLRSIQGVAEVGLYIRGSAIGVVLVLKTQYTKINI